MLDVNHNNEFCKSYVFSDKDGCTTTVTRCIRGNTRETTTTTRCEGWRWLLGEIVKLNK